MKTFNLAQLGVEELSNQELMETQGGTYSGSGGSLVSIGSVSVSPSVHLSPSVNVLNGSLNNTQILNSSSGCGCRCY